MALGGGSAGHTAVDVAVDGGGSRCGGSKVELPSRDHHGQRENRSELQESEGKTSGEGQLVSWDHPSQRQVSENTR